MDRRNSWISRTVGRVERSGDALVSGIGVAVSNSSSGNPAAFGTDCVCSSGRGGRLGFSNIFEWNCDFATALQGAAAMDAILSGGGGGTADRYHCGEIGRASCRERV